MPKVSVIIPVYNTERYLRRCLDGVLTQTLQDIEIIVINDCSPDNSDRIIEEYRARDTRLVSLKHSQNLGLGGARNTGISHASGEYQWHIDSDDSVDQNACSILYETAKKYDVDVLTFAACNIKDQNGCRIYADNYFARDKAICGRLYRGSEFLRQARERRVFYCAIWLNLIRSRYLGEFSKTVKFREHVAHQDTDYVPMLYASNPSVYCMHYTPYFRTLRNDSVTGKGLTEKSMADRFSVIISLLQHIQRHQMGRDNALVEFALTDYKYYLTLFENDFKGCKSAYTATLAKIDSMFNELGLSDPTPGDTMHTRSGLHRAVRGVLRRLHSRP